jgi:hypothetical protein
MRHEAAMVLVRELQTLDGQIPTAAGWDATITRRSTAVMKVQYAMCGVNPLLEFTTQYVTWVGPQIEMG